MYSFKLQNINQPVFAMFFIFRWQNDLTATYQSSPAINNSFGRNYFNVSGWYAPAGTTLPDRPMFVNLDAVSNNYFLTNEGHIKEYLFGVQGRYFANGASSAWAMPCLSYSQAPTAVACTYGGIDYGTIDQPTVRLYWNPDANGVYSTVQEYSNADIGSNSALRVDVVAFTYNNVDVSQYDMSRPYN